MLKIVTFAAILVVSALVINSQVEKTDNEKLLECLESIDGTDAQCDSCWNVIYHYRTN